MARDKRERTLALHFLHFNCVLGTEAREMKPKLRPFFPEANAGFLISHGQKRDHYSSIRGVPYSFLGGRNRNTLRTNPLTPMKSQPFEGG